MGKKNVCTITRSTFSGEKEGVGYSNTLLYLNESLALDASALTEQSAPPYPD